MESPQLSWLLMIPMSVIGMLEFSPQEGVAAMAFTLSSDSFVADGEIPSRHTCDGEDISPHLKWSEVPDGTLSFALIVDDPDAPDPQAPRMTWVHWVVFNLPPTTTELAAGVGAGRSGDDMEQGLNDWKRVGYNGPCPPIGRHRYFHKLYALDVVLPAHENATKQWLEGAMEGHILATAELVGTYQKRR